MSWGEVYKINEHAREREFNNSYIFEGTSTQNWNVPFNGYYKIIVVGAGGVGETSARTTGGGSQTQYYYECAGGGSGGVAIKTALLNTSEAFRYSPSTSQIRFLSTAALTPIDMIATNGGNGTATSSTVTGGAGGTATGGDFNYTGLKGATGESVAGASVGCFIPELMQKTDNLAYWWNDGVTKEYAVGLKATSGYGILGHGAGDGITTTLPNRQGRYFSQTEKQTGCVIVIPLEKV